MCANPDTFLGVNCFHFCSRSSTLLKGGSNVLLHRSNNRSTSRGFSLLLRPKLRRIHRRKSVSRVRRGDCCDRAALFSLHRALKETTVNESLTHPSRHPLSGRFFCAIDE